MVVEQGVEGRGPVAAAVEAAAAVPPLHAVPARLVLDGEQLVHVGRVVQPQLHPDEGFPDDHDHDGVEKKESTNNLKLRWIFQEEFVGSIELKQLHCR